MLKTIFSKSLYVFWFLLATSGSVYADGELDSGLKEAIAEGDLAKVKAMLPPGEGDDARR